MNAFRVALIAFLSAVLTPFVVAQNRAPVQLEHHDPTTPQGMEGGLWRTDRDFDSVLYLKNVLVNQAVTATPTIYMADGTSFDLQSITLDPAGVASVDVGKALQSLPQALQSHRSTFGTMGVHYKWSWAGAVLATIRNVDEVAMVSFESSLTSDMNVAHAAAPRAPQQRLEGPWWKATPDSTGFLVLSNTLLTPVPVTIAGKDASGVAMHSKQLVLQAHASEWVSLTDVLGSEPKVGDAGSLQLQYVGPDYALHVTGGMEDDRTGYSATLHMQELHAEKARNPGEHALTLDAPGLMYGAPDPKMHFPQDTFFQLYNTLHNTSDKQRDVALSLNYTGQGGPETHSLGSVSLAAHATQILDLSGMMKSAGVPPSARSVNLSLSFTGNESDLQAEVGSVDQSMNYVFAIYVQREEWTVGRTLCHWSLIGDNNTMISLWNYTDKAEDLQLTLYYRNGQYTLPIHLASRADYDFDIATLVNSRKPDPSGSVIPSNITEGSAVLTDVQGEGTKMSVATSSGEFNVRNATCGQNCQTCNGLSALSLITQPFALRTGDSMQSYASLVYNTNSSTTTTYGNWSTTTPAVTVTSTGLLSSTGTGAGFLSYTSAAPPYISYTCYGYNGGCPGPTTFQTSAPASSNTCTEPSSDTAQDYGTNHSPGLTYAEQFIMTLASSNGTPFNGYQVAEQTGATGQDSCYGPWSTILPQTTIPRPYTWTVGTPAPGSNSALTATQWGADAIGPSDQTTQYYQYNERSHGQSLPCGVSVNQSLTLSCPTAQSFIFENNTLSYSINVGGVQDCRNSLCRTVLNH